MIIKNITEFEEDKLNTELVDKIQQEFDFITYFINHKNKFTLNNFYITRSVSRGHLFSIYLSSGTLFDRSNNTFS